MFSNDEKKERIQILTKRLESLSQDALIYIQGAIDMAKLLDETEEDKAAS